MKDSLVLLFVAISVVSCLDNGMGLTPPIGWSTWCGDGPCGTDYCSEQYVMEAASAMQTNGMQKIGFQWVLLDDCWAAMNRTANKSITWDPVRFPNGIPYLVQWLHTRGFYFGLYTSAGNTTCSSGGRPLPIPGSEGYFQQDSNTFALWDVDYVKVDWCGDVKKMPIDGIAVGAKYYEEFSAALTSTTPKKSMYFEGVAAYIFLLWEVDVYVNAWRASTDHHDSWDNLIEVLATVEVVGKEGKPGAWSYMDVLMTGGQGCALHSQSHCPAMTNTEYYSEFALWSIYQSPLVVSTDVRNMTVVMKDILLRPRILEMHQNTKTGPGKHRGGDDSCGELGALTCQYFTRPMNDGTVVAVLFNGGIESHVITVDFAKVFGGTWSSSVVATVENLYTNSTTSSMPGQYKSADIPSHGVEYLVFAQQQKY